MTEHWQSCSLWSIVTREDKANLKPQQLDCLRILMVVHSNSFILFFGFIFVLFCNFLMYFWFLWLLLAHTSFTMFQPSKAFTKYIYVLDKGS